MSRKNNDDVEPDLEDKVIETEADAPGKETRTGEVKSGDEAVLPRRVPVFKNRCDYRRYFFGTRDAPYCKKVL